MLEFFLVIQFVLIFMILWKLGVVRKSLERGEDEQESARRQNNLLRALIKQLFGSKKSDKGGATVEDKQVATKPEVVVASKQV